MLSGRELSQKDPDPPSRRRDSERGALDARLNSTAPNHDGSGVAAAPGGERQPEGGSTSNGAEDEARHPAALGDLGARELRGIKLDAARSPSARSRGTVRSPVEAWQSAYRRSPRRRRGNRQVRNIGTLGGLAPNKDPAGTSCRSPGASARLNTNKRATPPTSSSSVLRNGAQAGRSDRVGSFPLPKGRIT